MPGQRQAAGKAEREREVLPALLPEEQKGREKKPHLEHSPHPWHRARHEET